MIIRIARKELTEIFRDGRFRVLAAVVLAVSLLSLAAGWKHYADVSRQHETAQAATRDQWLNQPAKNPHSAAHYGVYAFKPKSPLAMIDTGIDPYVGVAAWLEAHRQNEFKYRPAQDRTALQRFGELTAIIVAVSLAVSARARSSRLALVVLLAFWFVNSLVASRVVSDIAGWLHPTPSSVEFQRTLEADLSDPREVQARLERRRQELFAKYAVNSVDALPIAFSGISLQEGEERANEVFDVHYGRLFELYDQQNRVAALGGIAAPMLAVRSLSMGLAGTDFAQHRHFVTAAEAYRRDIQRVLNNDIAVNQRPGQVYLAGRELWTQVPDFDYTAPPARWVLAQHAWSLGILGAWLVAASLTVVRASATATVD